MLDVSVTFWVVAAPTVSAEQAAWQRVAEHVRDRRFELGLSQDDLGASKATVSLIENAKKTSYSRSSLASISRALQWRPNAIEAILAGDEPTPADAVSDPADDFIALYRRLENEVSALRAEVKALLDAQQQRNA